MSSPSLVAVLFTDLVDSTAQHFALGADASEELRRTHDRVLTDAIEAHGGRVVKSTGDGIMATFPGASEATSGAIAIQQAIERHNRRADRLASLSVRTGISAGDVTWEDDDAFGTPAIEAARLCAEADGGQILVADVVRLLAGAPVGDRFVPVGDLELKGLPQPLTTWEVGWQPDSEPVIPVPDGLAPVGGFSFVGRAAELELLNDAWQEVVGGRRRIVLVAGEPGIGKTRLISHFAEKAVDQGGVVLYGRAESELGVPYKPMVEALTGYVRTCPGQDLAAQTSSLSGDLTRLVPHLAARVPDLDEPLQAEPETQRYRLFEAVVELLANASTTWPLVLVLDDLQWAGKPTILLLGHLVASDPTMRLLVIGGYRDTEVGPDHPLTGLVAETHRVGGIETLSLGGLGESEVAELTCEAVGMDPGELAHQVVEATDGNPFFVSEILRAVTVTGPGEVDLAALGVPEGAQAMVTARLNQLDPAHRPVLQTAAVIGQRFDLPLLCAVIGDDDLTLAALADAEAAGLVGTHELLGGRQFAHALIRDALYHSLTPTTRVARHRQVVTALTTLPDADRRLGELAHHATEAIALLGIDTAVEHTRQAGDHAKEELAFEEAAALYQTAIDLLDQADQTRTDRYGDLQIALIEALYRSGMNEAGNEALLAAAATARRVGNGDRLAKALLAGRIGGYAQLWQPEETAYVNLYQEALAELGDDDSPARAVLLADLGERLWYRGSYDEAEELGFEALAVARRLGDDDTLREVLIQTYDFLQRVDNLGDRITRWGDELIETSYRAGDLETANRGLMHRAGCFMESCDLDRAEADLHEAERLLDSIGQPWFAFFVMQGRICLALIRGRLDEAERSIGELMGYAGNLPEATFQINLGTALACLWWQQGRAVDLLAATQTLMDEQPAMAQRVKVIAALIYAETGDEAAANELLDEFVGTEFATIPPDGLWLTSLTALAFAAVRTAHRTAAAAIESAIEPYADRIATQGQYTMGPVATALGSLAATQGNYAEAARQFRSASDLCERQDLRSFLALTRLHWAQMLTQRNEPDDQTRADELAHQALTAAEEIGMQRVAEQARDLLGRV